MFSSVINILLLCLSHASISMTVGKALSYLGWCQALFGSLSLALVSNSSMKCQIGGMNLMKIKDHTSGMTSNYQVS